MTEILACILTKTSWDPLQKPSSYEMLLNAWHTRTVWDNKLCVAWNLGVAYYAKEYFIRQWILLYFIYSCCWLILVSLMWLTWYPLLRSGLRTVYMRSQETRSDIGHCFCFQHPVQVLSHCVSNQRQYILLNLTFYLGLPYHNPALPWSETLGARGISEFKILHI